MYRRFVILTAGVLQIVMHNTCPAGGVFLRVLFPTSLRRHAFVWFYVRRDNGRIERTDQYELRLETTNWTQLVEYSAVL